MFIVSLVDSRRLSYCLDSFIFQKTSIHFQVPFAGIITGLEEKQEGLPISLTHQAWSLDRDFLQASPADSTARGWVKTAFSNLLLDIPPPKFKIEAENHSFQKGSCLQTVFVCRFHVKFYECTQINPYTHNQSYLGPYKWCPNFWRPKNDSNSITKFSQQKMGPIFIDVHQHQWGAKDFSPRSRTGEYFGEEHGVKLIKWLNVGQFEVILMSS